MTEIPTGWTRLQLGKSGRWLSGGTPSTNNPAFWNGDIPWISSGSLTNFRVSDSDRRVTKLGAQAGTRLVPPGTILMVVRGMSLKTEFRMGITQRTVAFGQDCKALIAAQGLDAKFLAYAVSARTPHILGIVDEAGHGTGRLNTDQLFAVDLNIPPMREQHAIARVLGAIDDKIAADVKLIATTEALMVAIAATAAHRVPVIELARQSTTSLRPEQFDERVVHFSLPAFDSPVRPHVAQGASIKSNKLLVDSALVLISKLNPRIPRIWDIPKAPEMMALASTEFVPLKPIDVGSSELWSVLSQPEVTTTLMGKVAGTSGSHQRVKPADVLTLSVRDPRALEESRRRALISLGLIRYERRSESAGLAAMRDALLPLLMSGKIRIKDVESVVEGVV